MAEIHLSFAATRIVISTLRRALSSDALFQPDKTGPSRSEESIVLDAWGYQVRDFPCLTVTGKPGKFRRMGIGDAMGNYFGLALVEEPGGTATRRVFDLPLITTPGDVIDLGYAGDHSTMFPRPKFSLKVEEKRVEGKIIHFVTLIGDRICPEEFPAKNFRASSPHHPTGMVFGGFYDMTMEVTASARNTQARDLLTDRAMAIMWIEKKRELRKHGVIVLDVAHAGFAQAPYGADQIYQSKLSVSVAIEWAAAAQYLETVSEISVSGKAEHSLIKKPQEDYHGIA
jgi:hypothetical protein